MRRRNLFIWGPIDGVPCRDCCSNSPNIWGICAKYSANQMGCVHSLCAKINIPLIHSFRGHLNSVGNRFGGAKTGG